MGVHFKSITALNFWVKIISIPVFQINMHYEKYKNVLIKLNIFVWLFNDKQFLLFIMIQTALLLSDLLLFIKTHLR